MEQEQLGRGYFRFNLPQTPDETEAVRIDEIFHRAFSATDDDLKIVERFEPSVPFWKLYSDCLEDYRVDDEASADVVVYCKGEDAEFLQSMLSAFRKAMQELPEASSSEAARRFLPALVNAHLRASVDPNRLETQKRYERAQSKDVARKLTAAETH